MCVAAVREHASVTHLDIGIKILVYLLIIHQTQQRLLKQTFLPRTCTAEQGACQRWPTAEHSRSELGMAWLLSDKRSLTFSRHACNHNNPSADVMPGDNNPFAVRSGRLGERLFSVSVVLSVKQRCGWIVLRWADDIEMIACDSAPSFLGLNLG